MQMDKYRKHILTAVFGVMLLYVAGDWLLESALTGPLKTRRVYAARVQKQIDAKEKQLATVHRAQRALKNWRARSLPSDPEVARSLYQAWLLKAVDDVGLSDTSIDSGSPATKRGKYQSLAFSVRGRGTLAQLTELLYKFYNAGHLHQLGSLGIMPVPGSDELDISLSVEALALFGADRNDRLCSLRSNKLASDSLDDYQVIVDRNLFSIGGAPNAAEHTVLTAVTSSRLDGQDRLVAWFDLRTQGETVRLAEGDSLVLDRFEAQVVEISGSDVIVEMTGERWLLTIGESLADALALPPEF